MTIQHPRVLVIDDQQDVAKTLTAPLTRAGMTLEFAADGEDGLERNVFGDFDLLVVDMKMPPGEWGGLWLLEQLKRIQDHNPGSRHVWRRSGTPSQDSPQTRRQGLG